MESLSILFLSHMVESIIDCYRNTTTRDKLIFPTAITCILTHLHVTIPPSHHFYVMGAISKKFIWRSAMQLAAKVPWVEPSDTVLENPTTPSSRPSSSSAPSSSSRATISLADITKQFHHMRANFGSHLDHLIDKMCQMNTRISSIAHRQSRLGGFAPLPSLELVEESSSSNGGNDDDDASSSEYDDEMTTS